MNRHSFARGKSKPYIAFKGEVWHLKNVPHFRVVLAEGFVFGLDKQHVAYKMELLQNAEAMYKKSDRFLTEFVPCNESA